MKYNVPCSSKTHGLSAVLAYKAFVRPENNTPENLKLAHYMGWCLEFVSVSLSE